MIRKVALYLHTSTSTYRHVYLHTGMSTRDACYRRGINSTFRPNIKGMTGILHRKTIRYCCVLIIPFAVCLDSAVGPFTGLHFPILPELVIALDREFLNDELHQLREPPILARISPAWLSSKRTAILHRQNRATAGLPFIRMSNIHTQYCFFIAQLSSSRRAAVHRHHCHPTEGIIS